MAVYTPTGGTFYSGFLGTMAIGVSGVTVSAVSGIPTLSGTPTGGTELPVISWGLNPETDIIAFRNALSGPNPVKEPTFVDDRSGRVVLDYNFAKNYYTPANGGLVNGAVLVNVAFYLHQTAKNQLNGPFYFYSSIIIKGNPVTLDLNGRIGLQFMFESNGPFFPPQT